MVLVYGCAPKRSHPEARKIMRVPRSGSKNGETQDDGVGFTGGGS